MVAEDFVKSAAVEKHPTTRNTHYYEKQVTEEDAEALRAPTFHTHQLKTHKAMAAPLCPLMPHMLSTTGLQPADSVLPRKAGSLDST